MPELFDPLFEQMDFRFSATENGALNTRQAADRLSESSGEAGNGGYKVIYPQFRILSADTPTRNLTYYTKKSHKGVNDEKTEDGRESTGQYSFVKPYGIPLIKEHKTGGFWDGDASETFGRIIDAKVITSKESGISYLAGLGEVSHAEAIEEIMTGRWLTGSLGSSVTELSCGLCGHKYKDSNDMWEHDHRRGKFYKATGKGGWDEVEASTVGAQPCWLQIDGYRAKEYSRVLVPSDVASQVQVRDTALGGGNFGKRSESEETPVSLWVPMHKSASAGVESFGSRYMDLTTGKESLAEDLGMRSGIDLYEHLEQLQTRFSQPTPSAQTLGLKTEESHKTEDDKDKETPQSPAKESLDNTPDFLKESGKSIHRFHSALKLTRLTQDESLKALRPELLRIGRRKGWSPRESLKENLLDPKNPQGPHALELSYKTASGKKQTYSFLPRSTESERQASLKLLENEDILSVLTDESEEALKALLTAEAAEDTPAIALELSEANFSMYVALTTDESVEESETLETVSPAVEALKTQIANQESQIAEILTLLKAKETATEKPVGESEEEVPVVESTFQDRPVVLTYKAIGTQLEKELLSDTELAELSDEEILAKVTEFYTPVKEDTPIVELAVSNPLIEEGVQKPVSENTDVSESSSKDKIALDEKTLKELNSLHTLLSISR